MEDIIPSLFIASTSTLFNRLTYTSAQWTLVDDEAFTFLLCLVLSGKSEVVTSDVAWCTISWFVTRENWLLAHKFEFSPEKKRCRFREGGLCTPIA